MTSLSESPGKQEDDARSEALASFQKALNNPEKITISKEFFSQVCGMLHIVTQISSIVFEKMDEQDAIVTLPDFEIRVRDVFVSSEAMLDTIAKMDLCE